MLMLDKNNTLIITLTKSENKKAEQWLLGVRKMMNIVLCYIIWQVKPY